MFPRELELNAFRTSNGEFGWTRTQIPTVVEVLCSHRMGILGGELWWIQEGSKDWFDLIPQRHGPPAVYPWETTREAGESWDRFIDRAAAHTLAAVARWPVPRDLPEDLDGRVLYNLTWISEEDFEHIGDSVR